MCNFFSFVSDGRGNVYYFDAEQRAALRKSNPQNYDPDSHTSIAHANGFKEAKEDKLNKWEYNPLTCKLVADYWGNCKDDSKFCEQWVKSLDFSTIVPELIIAPILHPLKIKRIKKISEKEKQFLRLWASVRDSVWASVGDSVGDSVGNSVRHGVAAYVSSFFNLSQWKYIEHISGENPFQSCIDLWKSGLVPSFDGKTWRLHSGPKAEVVYEWTPEKGDS